MNFLIKSVVSRESWETFLLTHQPNALFQSWTWGEVLEQQGKTIWRFGLYQGNNLHGVFQVVKVIARRGSFLHIRHGPVLIQQSPAYWNTVLMFLRNLAIRENVWFIRCSPLIPLTVEHTMLLNSLHLLPAAIHAMDAELCWVLDVAPSEEQLLTGMRKTTRYEIRRAQKLGISIEKSENPRDLVHFHRLYVATSERHGFVPHSGIDEEFKVFANEHKALLFLGRYEEKVHAAAIILFYEKQAIYHHSASISNTVGVNYLTQWEAIKEAKKRGMNVYNFWGIAPENKSNHPWQGLSLFKRGFGGRIVEYIHAYDLPVSPLYYLTRSVETIRRIIKRY